MLYILEGEKCKCNLLKKDDYVSIIISTLGEFIGEFCNNGNSLLTSCCFVIDEKDK